ncbi:MAG: hypothetical protein JO190_01080 [Candidatus Eremiobacteraeota bacterium]|nr:hypothetical protein [Candidatus Eremiobacteraeota bacterium]MBV8498493.1 hypothetical protein [Candidatus Eremiobacteraeota bacterium]
MAPSSYQVLYSFAGGSDGAYPQAPLIDLKGTLYGTTKGGGAGGNGTVFRVTTTGIEKVLYSFAGGSDGAYPEASLTKVNGTLYGTTNGGGASGYGTVFSVTTTGTEKSIYSFAGGSDGAYPQASLTNVNGTLYGTTVYAGAHGFGTVFRVTTTGIEKVLYSFAGGSDAANPKAGLIDVNGTLYGTTYAGGNPACLSGCGTVFSVTTAGAEKVLYSFAGGSDGEHPVASLIEVNGTLYGTTRGGTGNVRNGTVFGVTTTRIEKVLHLFTGRRYDGEYPEASLIKLKGRLYGTTWGGTRAAQNGAIFSVTMTGTEKVLYGFADGSDGENPEASLINVNGTLYGTTLDGGGGACSTRRTGGCGTVFAFTP